MRSIIVDRVINGKSRAIVVGNGHSLIPTARQTRIGNEDICPLQCNPRLICSSPRRRVYWRPAARIAPCARSSSRVRGHALVNISIGAKDRTM